MMFSEFQHKFNQAREFLLTHQYGRALVQYEKLTRQWPREAVLWAEYGKAASGAGQFDFRGRKGFTCNGAISLATTPLLSACFQPSSQVKSP